VTGIDWAAKTNRLVTCSEDRNAYVWTYQANDGVWKPTLVILRINRAATHVRWSPNEDKFAVASGAKVVSVCYFEEDNDWWVSKHIKKHRSTVLCVDWHPSNLLILTGSADFTCRIFSAAVKGVDKKPRDAIGSFQAAALMQFGEQLMEMPAQGWVHSARFSPSGNLAAFVSHDSSVSICDISSAENQPWRVKHTGLPFHTCLFLNEYTLVVAGHEYKPYLVQQQQDGSWALTRNLDEKKAAAAGGPAKVNAFAMFANKVATGQDQRKGDKQETKHQNCITHLDLYQGSPDNVSAFTSSGIDGLVVVWNGPW
jgi:actin related protein 2/3 complex subunit 1A/1B